MDRDCKAAQHVRLTMHGTGSWLAWPAALRLVRLASACATSTKTAQVRSSNAVAADLLQDLDLSLLSQMLPLSL